MSSTPPPPPPPGDPYGQGPSEPGPPQQGPGPDHGQAPPPPPPGGGYGAPPGGGYGDGGGYGGYGAQPPSGGYGGYGGQPPASPAWSVGEAVSYGWDKYRANLGQVLLAILIVVAVNAVLQFVGYSVNDSLVLSLVFNLVSFVVTTVVSAGIIRGALDLTEGRPIEAGQVLTPPRLPQLLVLAVVTGVLVTVGLVLCVVPGLVVLFFTAFSTYFLMDRPDLDAIGAIKASFGLVKDNVGPVLLWFLTCIGLFIAGLLVCFVGLLVALPVIYIGTAFTYKRLTGQAVAT